MDNDKLGVLGTGGGAILPVMLPPDSGLGPGLTRASMEDGPGSCGGP